MSDCEGPKLIKYPEDYDPWFTSFTAFLLINFEALKTPSSNTPPPIATVTAKKKKIDGWMIIKSLHIHHTL